MPNQNQAEKESCYNCIHKPICKVRHNVRSSLLQDPLMSMDIEWYEDVYRHVRKACKEFKSTEDKTAESKCLGCGSIITPIKGKGRGDTSINLTCHTCGTQQGYFSKLLKPNSLIAHSNFHCNKCNYQLVSSGPVIANLKTCPGCDHKVRSI